MATFTTSWVAAEVAQVLGNVASPGGSVNWTNASNSVADDGSLATAALDPGTISRFLQHTLNNAGGTLSKFNDPAGHAGSVIPEGVTLIGVELQVEKSVVSGSGTPGDSVVRFRVGTTTVGLGQGGIGTLAGAWSGVDTYGGPSNAMGLTIANLQSLDFRIQISCAESDEAEAVTVGVDMVRIRAHYTDGPALSTGSRILADGRTVELDFDRPLAGPLLSAGDATLVTNNASDALARTYTIPASAWTVSGSVARAQLPANMPVIGQNEIDPLISIPANLFTETGGRTSPAYTDFEIENKSEQRLNIFVAEGGSDLVTAGGTSATPASLVGVAAALLVNSAFNQNTVIHLKGNFYETLVLNSVDDLELRPWEGESPLASISCATAALLVAVAGTTNEIPEAIDVYWTIRADVEIDNGDFVSHSGSVYKITGVAEPETVTEDYDPFAAVPKGHLLKGSSASLSASQWWWESAGGGTLYIRASDSSNVTTNGKRYARHIPGHKVTTPEGGLFVTRAVGFDSIIRIEGGLFAGWTGTLGATGETTDQAYGAFIEGGENSYMVDCVCVDGGFHPFGFVGPVCVNNLFDHCLAKGMAASSNGASAFVFYASTGEVSGEFRRCAVHQYTHQTPAGASLSSTARGIAAYQNHGAGTTTGVLVNACVASGTAGCLPRIYDTTEDQGSAPSDPFNFDGYTIRVDRGVFANQATWGSIGALSDTPKYVAWRRCVMDFGLCKNASSVIACWSFSEDSRYLFEMCLLTGDFTGSLGRVFYTRGGDGGEQFRLVGCTVSFINTNADSAVLYRFESTSSFIARGCIFDWRGTAGRFHNGEAGTTGVAHGRGGKVDVETCWFSNMAQSTMSNNSAYNTQAEWRALLDPTGLSVFAQVEFTDASGGNFSLSPAMQALRQHAVELSTLEGLDGKPYAGVYGAFQTIPPTPGRRRLLRKLRDSRSADPRRKAMGLA